MRKNKPILQLIISFLTRILGSFSLLLLTFLISRSSSTHDAGIFFQILSLTIPIATIARFGADISLIKILKNEKKSRFAEYLSIFLTRKTLSLSIIISSLVFLSIVLTKLLLGNFTYMDLYYASIVPFSILTALINLSAIVLQAKEKVTKSILIKNVLPYLITFILLTLINLFNYKIGLTTIVSTFAVANVLLIFFNKTKLWKVKNEFKTKKRELVSSKYSSLIFYFSLLLMLQQWVSIATSSYFLEPIDLAYLNILTRISNTLAIILIALNSIYVQRFAKEISTKSYMDLRVLIRKSSKIAAIAGLAFCILYFLFSSELLHLFGEEYSQNDFLLRILVLGQLINLITGPAIQVIMMLDNIKSFFFISLKITILLTFITIFLVYQFGLEGAVYSQFLFTVVINVMNISWLRLKLNKLILN